MTTVGFFSIVSKPGQSARGELTVRARSWGDLAELRRRFLPTLGPTAATEKADYPYRAVAPAADVARAAAAAVADIAYGNFKGAVAAAQGSARATVYHAVWSALRDVDEPSAGPTVAVPPKPPGRVAAYGGVVFDAAGRVLLRRTAGDFGGVRWTFPKGRPAAGEPPAATAVREVRQEAGVDAAIVDVLPRYFPGQVTHTLYFVMDLRRDVGDFDRGETAAVQWATPVEAERLIHQSAQPGRSRDLAVLAAAVEARS